MMRLFFHLLCLIFMLAGCAERFVTLPDLAQSSPAPAGCPTLFPQGNYQFVHLIEFSMAGGNHGTAMGVTVIKNDTIESVLMTVEGFVLFSAVLTDTLSVTRAVPPFDKPGFAEGMMADIKTIFLEPEGLIQRGQQADGTPTCRLIKRDNHSLDIVNTDGQCQRLTVYSADKKLQTIISGFDCTVKLDGNVIPEKLTLQSRKLGGYRLSLTLVSAEKIADK